MEKKNIRIAIIGAGRVAQHYKKIMVSPAVSGFQVVGVCDIKINAAIILGSHWNCPVFTDIFVMIHSVKPDLVIVLTPSGLHFEHARICLEENCNVLVEKPATMIPEDASKLVAIAEANNLMLGVAFQNRLNPAIIFLKNAIDKNRFGQITTATIRLRWCRYQDYYEDDWHGTWAQDGGVINQQAIHHIDALRWLLGPIESVCGAMENRLNRLEAEDTMVAVLRFSGGALGTLEATTAARPCDIEASLSVIGEGGVAVIGGIALNKVETWKFVDPIPEEDSNFIKHSREVPNGYGLSHELLLQETIDRLQTGSTESPIPVKESILTSQLIHSIYRSCEIGGWVKLSDNLISSKLGQNFYYENRE